MGANEVNGKGNILANKAMSVFGGAVDAKVNILLTQEEQFQKRVNMAQYLSESNLVPSSFRNNPADIYMAAGIANQMGMDLSIVLQNLDIIQGKIGWKSTFVIAIINKSGRFASRLKFEFVNTPQDKSQPILGWGCRAYVIEHDGTKTYGSWITTNMAKAEGWSDKLGSKWLTMPEQMLMYRAAAFFGRVECPDLLMGFQHIDEILDYENTSKKSIDLGNEISIDLTNSVEKIENEIETVCEDKKIDQKETNVSVHKNKVAPMNNDVIAEKKEATSNAKKPQSVKQKKVVAQKVTPVEAKKNLADEMSELDKLVFTCENAGFYVNEPRARNDKWWLIVDAVPFGDEMDYEALTVLGFVKSSTTDSYALEITSLINA